MGCNCDPDDFHPSTLMWITEEEITCTECDKPYSGKLDMTVKENIEANVIMDTMTLDEDALPAFKGCGHIDGICLLADVAVDCNGDYSIENSKTKMKV